MQDPFYLQQLKSCDLFRELNSEELSLLYDSMVQVNLKAGEVLVTQGEISDSMYVLLSGRLLVKTSDGKTVGQISRGQTVGEMGLITQEPRSATVMALRDSVLLKLDNVHFNQVWEKHPSVLFEVTKMITQRLQKTLKANQNYNHDSNIVLLKGHDQVDMSLFLQKFLESFDQQFRYKILKRSDFSKESSVGELHKRIQELEDQYDYLFYLVEGDPEWQELCLERADRIVVIVDASQKPGFDSEIITLLTANGVQTEIKKILILLHRRWAPPTNTAEWLKPLHFMRHHHLCLDDREDFSRLLRFVNGTAIGLVLGGGGTRVWAQIGAIKYLFEQKIPIDAYAGTSAGSISAGVLSIARDYQEFLEMSEKISRLMKFNEYTIPVASILSSASLTQALKNVFSDLKIENLKKMLFCVAADLVSASEIDICEGLLWRAIRASSSIPGVYPPVHGDGRVLVDGAVMNNLPVDVMRHYFEGFGKIISIDISEVSASPIDYQYPLELSWLWVLRHKIFSRSHKFKVPSIASTVLKGLMLASDQKSSLNMKLSDLCIKPVLSGFGLLDLSKKEQLLDIGYEAAQTSLKDWPTILNIQRE